MPISFNQIPAGWRVPLYYVEVDPSKAGMLVLDQPALLVGQMFAPSASIVGVPNIPVAVASEAQAIRIAGRGSMLHRMVVAFLANNMAQELWAMPVLEPAAGVAATGTFTFTGTATQAGIVSLYIAGQRVQVGIASGDAASAAATKAATAINANTDLPVTAAAAAGVVTLTVRWKGATGNDIRLAHSFGGARAGEAIPPGLAVAVAQPSGGVGSPDLSSAIANLGDEPYEYVAFPFADSVSLGAIETEYGFSDAGRWGWMRQLYGHVFSAERGTYSGLLTAGASRNSGVTSIMATEATVQSPTWEVAAAYTAQAARALLNDPARPLQTLPLRGVVAAPKEDRFTLMERNALANGGFAIQSVQKDGTMMVEREGTTYLSNSYGQPDDALSLVTTLATLSRLFRRQKQAITSKYARHKLANDGTRFGPGQAIVTPNIIRAELVAEYRAAEYDGLVEDVDNFKRNLIVERDANDTNRINVQWPPDLINQLRIFAVLAQFRLQFSREEVATSGA
jgi:phage tail sheath gpL-like